MKEGEKRKHKSVERRWRRKRGPEVERSKIKGRGAVGEG
jgi:hypothetical protein